MAAKPRALPPTPAQQLEPVFELMREGESTRRACAATGVAVSTVYRLLDGDEALQEQYAQARARMLDAQAEMLEEIGEQAALAETAVEVAGLRLKSDNRKWLLSKLAPKKYGDRTTLAGDPDSPLAVLTMEAIAADPRSRLAIK